MTDRPDPADWIAKRRELLAAATEGPWEADGTEISQHWSCPEPWKPVASNEVACMAYCYGGSGRGIEREDDANLIADARTSLPRALDALEAVLAPHQLHEVPGGQRWCLHCGADWPCPTVDAAETALRGDS